MLNEKIYVYDTKGVVDVELDDVFKKHNISEETDEITMNAFLAKIEKYIRDETELFFKEMYVEEARRLDYTIEDSNGEIWICAKVFNINRFQKMFETEP